MNPTLLQANRILATWFGCGLSPKAPGTVGTLGAIPLVIALSWYTHDFQYMGFTLVFSFLAIVVAHIYEADSEHDAPSFVMDEVAGFLVTMTWIPCTPTALVAGFVIFRALDIFKPFPISYIDRKIEGGVGTVADDLVAGIFANVVLHLMLQNGVPL